MLGGNYSKFKSHQELKDLIGSLIESTNSLPYTETSKTNQNMIYIGFYQGYCYANDWEIDYQFIFSYLSPLPLSNSKIKPTTTPTSNEIKYNFDVPMNKPVTTPNTLHIKPLEPPSGIPDFLKDFDWSKHRN
jgi:hypothetical protein